MREVSPLLYINPEFDEAEEMFDQIVQDDPYRLEDLDVYSNILYVMEKSSKLAYLAQQATQTDKFRVETCCIVGTNPHLTNKAITIV
jgi:anaphase-promoting complex subunit 8